MNSSMPKSAILGGLPIVGAPTDIDVVFGRGGFANRHEGNKRYLELIGKHEKEYLGCQRKYQKLISMCIIHQLRSQGTRFLKKDEKSGTWKTVKLSQCRLKISQRLRERAPFIKLEQMQARKGVRGATKASSPMVQQTKKSPSFVQTNVIDLFSDDEKSCTCRESWEEESLSPLPPFHDVEDGDSLAPLRSMFESIFGYDPFSFECNGESDQPYQTFSEKRACITMNSSFGESDEPRMNKRRKISFDQNELSRTGYGYINLPCRESGLDDISIVSDLSLPPTEMDQFQLDEDDLDHFMVTLESSATGDDALFEYLDVLF